MQLRVKVIQIIYYALYKIEDFLLFFCYNKNGDNMNDNDLLSRVFELERRVAKLEKINKRNFIFKIISLVLSIILLLVLLYVFYYYYSNLMSFF